MSDAQASNVLENFGPLANHVLTVMQDELQTAMRNNGITTLDEASPDLVHTADVDHLVPSTRSHPYARAVAKGRQRVYKL